MSDETLSGELGSELCVARQSQKSEPFPRPELPADVIVYDSRSGGKWFELLRSHAARDLLGKVQPRSPTRLLLSSGWVFKTSTAFKDARSEIVRERVMNSISLARQLGVWHPAKSFFVLRAHGYFWPCSASPCVTTVTELTAFAGWMIWVCRVLPLLLVTLARHRLILDPLMRNYGVDPSKRHVCYLDDEVYMLPGLRDVMRLRHRGILR